MRRIIERVVTVVTTTTWTISWQADTSPGDPQVVSAAEDISNLDGSSEAAKTIQELTSVFTKKEAGEEETKMEPD